MLCSAMKSSWRKNESRQRLFDRRWPMLLEEPLTEVEAVAVAMEEITAVATGATIVTGTERGSLRNKKRRTAPIITARPLAILETTPMKNPPWTNTKTLPRIINPQQPTNPREKRKKLKSQLKRKNPSKKLPIDYQNLERRRRRRWRRADRQLRTNNLLMAKQQLAVTIRSSICSQTNLFLKFHSNNHNK